MMKPMRWIDRKFTFDMSVGLFPNMVVRLRGAPVRLEEATSGLTVDELRRKFDGKWSIQETVGHLLSVDDLHIGRLDDFIAEVEILRAADMTNQQTEKADYNEMELGSILAEFRTKRLGFVHRLEEVDQDLIGRPALHPRLQVPMRLIDMVYFTAEHDDNHLVDIFVIRSKLGK
jgi:uncharacterized damage-inducible protein DinB